MAKYVSVDDRMNVSIEFPEMPEDLTVEQQADFVRCVQYMTMHDMGAHTREKDIAEYFGITERTLRNWRLKWISNGLMVIVRNKIVIPLLLDTARAGQMEVLGRWRDVLLAQVEIATNGRSEMAAVSAARFLYDSTVVHTLANVGDGRDEQLDYIEGLVAVEIDPMSITKSSSESSEAGSQPESEPDANSDSQ